MDSSYAMAPVPPLAVPLQGLFWLLRHPGAWPRLLAGWLCCAVMLVAVAVLAACWSWPSGEPDWHWLWRVPLALGAAMGAVLALWALLLPPLLAWLCEGVARRVLVEAGCAAPGESLAAGLVSTLRVMLATAPLRLLAVIVALLSGLLGPLGLLVAAGAVARIAALDAYDLVLSVAGQSGAPRLQALRAARPVLGRVALGAIPLHFALGFTIVGWVLWLPSLVAGMAQWHAAQLSRGGSAAADTGRESVTVQEPRPTNM